MSRNELYRVAKNVKQFLAITRLPPEKLLKRAGLPIDFLEHEGVGIDAATYFNLAEAVAAEAKRSDFALFAARASANGPLITAVYAFVCSPTIRQGLDRLRLFKPLVGPITLTVSHEETALRLTFGSADPDAPISAVSGAYELVYFVEMCRKYTAENIVPLEVGLPDTTDDRDKLDTYFGTPTSRAETPSLVLPAGSASADDVCDKLMVAAAGAGLAVGVPAVAQAQDAQEARISRYMGPPNGR